MCFLDDRIVIAVSASRNNELYAVIRQSTRGLGNSNAVNETLGRERENERERERNRNLSFSEPNAFIYVLDSRQPKWGPRNGCGHKRAGK